MKELERVGHGYLQIKTKHILLPTTMCFTDPNFKSIWRDVKLVMKEETKKWTRENDVVTVYNNIPDSIDSKL